MTTNNVLGFTDIESERFVNLSYNDGLRFSTSWETGKLPNFQLPVASSSSVTSVILKSENNVFGSGIGLNITTEAGLTTVDQSDGYYAIESDGSAMALHALITEWVSGNYRIEIVHDGVTYYSEMFTWCDSIANLVKIEYWHNSRFLHGDGAFTYDAGYKNVIYVGTDIGKPNYVEEERVVQRDGLKLPIMQIQWKQFGFNVPATEYFIDALRLVKLHDNVEITHKGRVYEVDEFIMETPNWDQKGDIASVDCYFTNARIAKVTGDSDETVTLFEGEYNGDFNNDFTITP